MSTPNSSPLPEGENFAQTGFNSQGSTDLAEVMQRFCSDHRSGQITFRSGESFGYVYLQHGRVLHAVCGGVEGEEAVYRMLAWPQGGFVLDEGILPHRRTVQLTWEQLLFEGARRADTTGLVTPSTPIVTAEPVTTSRAAESLPKLTIVLPDQRPMMYQIEAEYTHVGRANGNEIPLFYPSVSNRHCMFILSGSDVVLRDLNSSNGTIVNGETISEVILRPGDLIQVGVVQIKFEPGVRRPKLTSTAPTARPLPEAFLNNTVTLPREPEQSFATMKLPNARPLSEKGRPIADDSAFVKGEAPISYDNLPKPEVPGRPRPVMLIVTGLILVLLILGGGGYYFFIFRH